MVRRDAAFTQVVRDAFAAWEVADPTTGLVSSVSFNERLDITATDAATTGAEIDLMATDLASVFGNPAATGGTGGMSVSATASPSVTLTSGVTNYSQAYSTGGIVNINNNPAALWTLGSFQAILTHEIGHALGLGDVELNDGSNLFRDDNYDGSNANTIAATLTNGWSDLINPLDPENDPDVVGYLIPFGDFDNGPTNAPNLVMETQNDGVTSLTVDEFAARQFLYPSTTLIPEPSTPVLGIIGLALVAGRRKRMS